MNISFLERYNAMFFDCSKQVEADFVAAQDKKKWVMEFALEYYAQIAGFLEPFKLIEGEPRKLERLERFFGLLYSPKTQRTYATNLHIAASIPGKHPSATNYANIHSVDRPSPAMRLLQKKPLEELDIPRTADIMRVAEDKLQLAVDQITTLLSPASWVDVQSSSAALFLTAAPLQITIACTSDSDVDDE